MRVTVLGAGSWGTTVASLSAGRNPTLLWARNPDVAAAVNEKHENQSYLAGFTLPDSLRATSDLEEAVSNAEVLVVGVPSHGFRAVLEQAAPHVPHWDPGGEPHQGVRGRDAVPDDGGHPRRAPRPGGGRAVGPQPGQGLSVGDNTRAAVISRGLAELTRLGVAMGAEPATLAGLAGMGDLIATCVSPLSRNRQVGERLGKGESIDEILGSMNMVAEGVKTAHTVMELAARYGVELPICAEIRRVVSGEIAAPEAYRGLMRRAPAGHESGPV